MNDARGNPDRLLPRGIPHRLWHLRAAALWPALILLCGCAVHPVAPPAAASIVLSHNLGYGAARWEKEVARRFDHAVIVYVHGGKKDGIWQAFPDSGPPLAVEALARLLRKLYPGRPIVLICCDEAGLPLNVRGVWYAPRLVMGTPGDYRTDAGRISQFIEGQ